MPLEVLHFPLVLLRGVERVERAEVAALPRLRVLLPRVEAIAARLQLSDHRAPPPFRIPRGARQGARFATSLPASRNAPTPKSFVLVAVTGCPADGLAPAA